MGRFFKVLIAATLLAIPAGACTIAIGCPHNGPEMRRDFVVTVKHLGKPLAGATVTVIPPGVYAVPLTGETGPEGTLQFNDLPPENYRLEVSRLGISSIYTCFHVSKRTTGLNAKRSLTFNWGNDAPETRQVAGRLIAGNWKDQAGHKLDIPLVGNKLTLHNAVTGASFETETDINGAFTFSDLATGTYVLHAHEAKQPFNDGDYAPGNVLIRFNPAAKRDSLVVQRNIGGGDCSGPLALQEPAP